MPNQHDPVSPDDPRFQAPAPPRTTIGRALARVRRLLSTSVDESAAETGRTVASSKVDAARQNVGFQSGGLGGPRA